MSAIVKRGAVFTIGSRNLPYCFLFAFLTGVCGSYFFRFKIYKLLFKNRYEEYEQFSLIANGKGVDRFMRAFFGAVVTVCVIGCVLFAKQNITFLKDGFTDNTKLLKLSGDFYGYDEIERVYYKPDRVNDYGDMLDYPSYVIELKNGKQIDLYEMAEIENYETELTKLLNGKGVRMEKQE